MFAFVDSTWECVQEKIVRTKGRKVPPKHDERGSYPFSLFFTPFRFSFSSSLLFSFGSTHSLLSPLSFITLSFIRTCTSLLLSLPLIHLTHSTDPQLLHTQLIPSLLLNLTTSTGHKESNTSTNKSFHSNNKTKKRVLRLYSFPLSLSLSLSV